MKIIQQPWQDGRSSVGTNIDLLCKLDAFLNILGGVVFFYQKNGKKTFRTHSFLRASIKTKEILWKYLNLEEGLLRLTGRTISIANNRYPFQISLESRQKENVLDLIAENWTKKPKIFLPAICFSIFFCPLGWLLSTLNFFSSTFSLHIERILETPGLSWWI